MRLFIASIFFIIAGATLNIPPYENGNGIYTLINKKIISKDILTVSGLRAGKIMAFYFTYEKQVSLET